MGFQHTKTIGNYIRCILRYIIYSTCFIATFLTFPGCRHTARDFQPPAAISRGDSDTRQINLSPEMALPDETMASLYDALLQHESWDMADYDSILGSSYYYNGFFGINDGTWEPYLLLIRKTDLLQSLAELSAESAYPGYARLQNFIETTFGDVDCFEDWHILGKRDLFGHMGETGNIGLERYHWAAVARTLERGSAVVVDSTRTTVIETLYVGEGIFPASTEYLTPDGVRVVVVLSGFESESRPPSYEPLPADGPRYHK